MKVDATDPMAPTVHESDEKTAALALLHTAATGNRITLSSFKTDNPAGARMLVQATLLPCEPLADVGTRELLLTDWYAHDAGRADEQGEYEEWTRIVLFTADGKVYSCGSRGVAKSLAVFSIARNSLHFDPPIKCVAKRQQLAGGKQWLSLIPDIDTLCPAPSGKAGGSKGGK